MKKLNSRAVRRTIMAVFCLFICVCVAYLMFTRYDPTKNSLVALSSVCMDVVCIIILFILICSFAFANFGATHTTGYFATLLIATIWALFLDFVNWSFDGRIELWHLTYWCTVGSLCMGSVLAGIFPMYLCSYIEEIHALAGMRIRSQICTVLNALSFVMTFVLALTGTAFEIVDGHYVTGILYDMVTVIPVLTLVYLTCYIVRSYKKIGVHDVLAAAGYIFFMISGALIEASFNIGTTYVSVAIADVFIYVMLQNEVIATEKRHVEEWKVKSNTDELTGLNNRNAYEADMKILENNPTDDNLVYVSIDVNSLKQVNDSLGHAAGDEMLVGASECLKKAMSRYGKLYRIGGDEFTALIFADDRQLEAIKNDISERTGRWQGKAGQTLTLSCGFVAKREDMSISVRQMATAADKKMYSAKEEHYRQKGIDRRKA